MSRSRLILWSWLAALPAAYILAPALPLAAPIPEAVRQTAFVTPFALVTVGALLAGLRSAGRERRFWSVLAMACLLLTVNEVRAAVWVVRGIPLVGPHPPLSAIFAVPAAVVFIGMLLSLSRSRAACAAGKARFGLDVVLIATLGAGAMYTLVARPLLEPLHAPVPVVVLAAVYSTAGLTVLLASTMNLLRRGRRAGRPASQREPWLRLLVAGISVYALGVVAWPWWYAGTMGRGSDDHLVVELLWMCGQAIAFAAAFERLRLGRSQLDRMSLPCCTETRSSVLVAWSLPLATAVAGMLLYVLHGGGAPITSAWPIAAAGSLAVALVVRAALLATEVRVRASSLAIDPVTGLEGQRRLRDTLASALVSAERLGHPVSVMVFDLDGLDVLNRDSGRAGGDEALRSVASVLRSVMPDRPVLRSADDAIAIIAVEADPDAAFRLALRARWDAEAALGEAFPMTLSCGIATFPNHASTAEGLLVLAARAAHSARRDNDERISVYSGEDTDASDPYVGMLRRIARSVDERDGHAHGAEVAALAAALARRMLLTEDRVALVSLAAELHDIGKVALPHPLLSDEDAITAEEHALLHEHPVLGARMLSTTSVGRVADWVLASHEAWDGSGYPRALRGEEIPIEARIIAVCDHYARTRRRHTQSETIAELGLERGRRLDPFIVDQFFYALHDMRRVRSERIQSGDLPLSPESAEAI